MKSKLALKAYIVAAWIAAVICHTPPAALSQGTAFTYQGRIDDGANPANGSFDMRFALFDAASAGVAQGNPLTNAAAAVSNGIFTVTLDFGNQFPGANRWLEIAVRTNGSGAFSTLTPRQALTPAPYAVFAGKVNASGISGTLAPGNIANGTITSTMLATGAVGSNQLAAGAVTTTALANGAVTATKVATVTNWFALTIANPTPAFNDRFANAVAAVGNDQVLIGAFSDDTGASSAGAAYLFRTNGTLLTTFTNPTPASFDGFGTAVAAVGSDRVLISAPFDATGASSAGAAYLFSTNGTLLASIHNPTPAFNDQFGNAVAAVGNDRVLIGALGDDTGASSAGAAYLFSTNGTLLTTFTNPTPADSDNFGTAVAAVGNDRVLIGALGDDTGASGAGAAYLFSTETFTDGLVADAVRARSVTTASLEDGAVTAAKIGGVLFPSQIPELNAFNITSGTLAEERLGNNVALLNRSPQSFTGTNHFTQRVGIGTVVSPDASLHIADGSAGAVTANASALLALEGDTNVFIHFLTPDAAFSGILFGSPVNSLDASIRYNFFGGRELIFRAGNNSTRMIILTNGNVGIGTSAPTEKLHVVGNILATGTITPSSDRNVKKNFSPVDPLAMLAKVSALPIQQWTYQAESDGIHHVGPMAQDFHAAFGLGANDVTIATVDADGVALAAIQGLNEKVEAQQTENAKLKAQNESLQKRLEALERSVQALVPPR